MESIGDIFAAVTSLGALIGSIMAVVIAYRKQPAETRVLNADAAGKVTQSALAMLEPLQERVEYLEKELGDACLELESLKKTVNALKSENEALQDWARRLVHQVRSLGGEPVKLFMEAKGQ